MRILLDIEDFLELFECVILDVFILLLIEYNCFVIEWKLLVFFVCMGGLGMINLFESVELEYLVFIRMSVLFVDKIMV